MMLNLQLDVKPNTEVRLRRLLSQMQDTEEFAQNIIAFRISELRRGVLNLRVDLKRFEDQYQMSSETFYGRFGQGQVDDAEDNMLWAGLYEMYRENQQQLQDLQ